MICTSCTIKKICNIYKIKIEHENEILISIKNCKYKNNKIEENIESDVITNSNVLKEQFDEEEYQKFLQRQNKEFKEIKTELMTCPSCGGQDYSEYITICSKCGKEVCGNCGTNDEGLTYCNKCWEEI